MPAVEPRYNVAEVTEESRDGWRHFCDRHGINPTVLAEIIGLRLGAMTGHPPAVVERWVRDAKKLAAERRRRG